MSQDRMNTPETQRVTSGSDYQAPDIDATLSRASSTLNKIRVVNGANEQYFDNLSGKTVGSVRKSLREVFNIPGDASALVGGKEVGDDFVLEGGMNLEFLKEAGVKGMLTTAGILLGKIKAAKEQIPESSEPTSIDDHKLKCMILELIEEIDYDIWKSFIPETSEDPEAIPERLGRLMEIARDHLEAKSKRRVFLRNLDSGEPACYCGNADDMADVVKSIGHMLAAELPELHDDEDAIDYRIEFKEMTDQEVEDLPDL